MVTAAEVPLHQYLVCPASVQSTGDGGACELHSVVLIAVRVGVRVAVVITISSLSFGLQRFWLKGQRLNDSTWLLHHFDLGRV